VVKLAAINLAFGEGWNPTHKNGDDLGMVYGVGFTTLPTKYMEIPVFTRICTM
jgi:hypothetical protein